MSHVASTLGNHLGNRFARLMWHRVARQAVYVNTAPSDMVVVHRFNPQADRTMSVFPVRPMGAASQSSGFRAWDHVAMRRRGAVMGYSIVGGES